MPNITATIADPFIPEVWANEALEVLRNNVVMAKLVTKDSELSVQRQGDTIHVPYPGTFTTNDKTAGSNVTLQAPSGGSDTQVLLNKHKEVSFVVEDAGRALANQDLLDRYMQAAIVPIVEQVETDIFGLYSAMTQSTGTSGTDITAATIRAARKKLNDNKAPLKDRSLVISSKDEIAVLGDSTLANYFAYQKGEAYAEGAIGRVYGFDVYMSQLVPVVVGAPNSTKNLAFNRGAMILASRALPDAPAGTGARSVVMTDPVSGLVLRCTTSYNAQALGVQVTFDVLYGVKVLRDAKAAIVLS